MKLNEVKAMSKDRAEKVMNDLLDVFNISMEMYLAVRPLLMHETFDPSRGKIKWNEYNLIVRGSVEDTKRALLEKNTSGLATFQSNCFIKFEDENFARRYEGITEEIVFDRVVKEIVKRKFDRYVTVDDYPEDNVLKVSFSDRQFEIRIYNTPDEIDYFSGLDNYDPETYLAVEITEIRKNNKMKYNVLFGVDIEKMECIEIFFVRHFNQTNVTRSLDDDGEIDTFQTNYFGRRVFKFSEN